MKTATLNPEVYRRAAARILERKELYSCHAIANQTRSFQSKQNHRDFFSEVMHPSLGERFSAGCWWDDYRYRENPRAIALLLCADILESEQKAQRTRKPANPRLGP
jgi:hypothetical protein